MYLILNRTLVNIGDYIYYNNALDFIRKYKPNEELFEVNVWKPIMKHIDPAMLRQIKATIITGGPCLQSNMYPDLYHIPSEILKFKIPIIFIGVGSKFYPGTMAMSKIFKFSKNTLRILQYSTSLGYPIGVRDILSKEILLNNGINEVVVNGCPSWYDYRFFGKNMVIPNNINSILFTTPANVLYFHQAMKIITMLKNKFSKARFLVSFHKGLLSDDGNKFSILSKLNRQLFDFALKKGWEVIDASQNSNYLKKYDNFDLHIGYRVHAHLYFLSHRRPSILISEDSRGIGVSITLGGLVIPAWSKFSEYLNLNKISRFGINQVKRIYGNRFPLNNLLVSKYIVKLLEKITEYEINNGFKSFKNIPTRIDLYFKKRMEPFIKNLP